MENGWQFELAATAAGYRAVAGVDEAGRGPLAGPVVAAAIILDAAFAVAGIDDSKRLSSRKRQQLAPLICSHAIASGIGIVGPTEIDRINILQATRKAMVRAVAHLAVAPDFLLIDGNQRIDFDMTQQTVVKGDRRSISIAAASIVAKVFRDRLMQRYHAIFPEYNFARHKGYPTPEHKAAVARFGCSPLHRRTFKGVREHLQTWPVQRPLALP
jgi:ribonuclease HII